MEPSAVRERILADHVTLREHLTSLEAAVAVMQSDPSRRGAIAEAARTLLFELIAHTEAEDTLLAPVLREIDAWGPIRATTLLEHHSTQRNQLRDLLALYEGGEDTALLAKLTRDWIYDVIADMAHEEASELSPSLLRDDSIAIAMEDG